MLGSTLGEAQLKNGVNIITERDTAEITEKILSELCR